MQNTGNNAGKWQMALKEMVVKHVLGLRLGRVSPPVATVKRSCIGHIRQQGQTMWSHFIQIHTAAHVKHRPGVPLRTPHYRFDRNLFLTYNKRPTNPGFPWCRNYTFASARLLDWCAINLPLQWMRVLFLSLTHRHTCPLSHVPKHKQTSPRSHDRRQKIVKVKLWERFFIYILIYKMQKL